MQTEAELLAGASPQAVTKAAARVAEPPKLTAKEVANLATNGGVAVAPAPVAASPRTPSATLAVPFEPVFLVEPRSVSEALGVSADRRKAEADYNAQVEAWKQTRSEMKALKHVADATAITIAECRDRCHSAREVELGLAQQAVALTRQYVGLLEARLPDQLAFAVAEAKRFAEAEADVIAKLNAAGVSVDSQPAARDNRHAAERTFMLAVKQVPAWQSANRAKIEAELAVQSTKEGIVAANARAAEAEKSLVAKVAKLVA